MTHRMAKTPALPVRLLIAASLAIGALSAASPGAPARPTLSPPPPSPAASPTPKASDEPAAPSVEPPFFAGTLQEALAKSIAEHRLLMVVVAPTKAREADEARRFSNPVLASWVQRHALLVRVTDRDTIKALTASELNTDPGTDPLFFKQGKLLRVLGTAWPQAEGAKGNQLRLRGPARPTSTFVGTVLRWHWTLLAQRRDDAQWFDAHARTANASPPAPVATMSAAPAAPAAPATDPLAPEAFAALAPEPAAARWLDTLERARAAATSGDTRTSTELYTWLWETGERSVLNGSASGTAASTTALRAALLTSVVADMKVLGDRDPQARRRWVELLQRRTVDADWSSAPTLWAYLALARAADRHVENLAFLDNALNDPDAGGLMPQDARFVLEDLLPRSHVNDPVGAASPASTIVSGLLARAKRPVPSSVRVAPAEWSRVTDHRRWLAGFEAARVYAQLLVDGRDQEASDVAKAIVDATDVPRQPGVRAELVVSALARRQARAEMKAWVGPELGARIDALLASAGSSPKPSPAPAPPAPPAPPATTK
jgi:hypothetical protein